MTRKNKFPGVTKTIDRHKKIRWRFRRKGFSCYLPSPYGSVEFVVAYEKAMQGQATSAKPRSKEGTLNWLIEFYLRSPRYQDRAPAGKKTLRSELEWLRVQAGPLPYAKFETRHVEALMARKAGPSAANRVKKNLSMLFNFAIKHGYHKFNPASLADRRKENPDGYHTWTEAEIEQYRATHPSGSKPRMVMLLLLNTGASRQDAIRLGWQNCAEGRIRFRRNKTGVEANLPILPELVEELDRLPRDQLLFITHSGGKPYKPETFGNWFKKMCKVAGLPHCNAHGLRKSLATRLANAGATPDEIRAALAHKTNEEGKTYTKQADRARLADSGLDKLLDAQPQRNLTNL